MNLPEYEPSDSVWQKIEAKLKQDTFQAALRRMPEYEPEEKVWENVLSKLNKSKFYFVRWAVAASVIIGIGLYFSMQNREIIYSKQEVRAELFLTEVDSSQYGYEEIQRICIEDKIACEKPEFKALETELEELNTASLELKTAIGKYNTEPDLIAQLADIENQKSEIINRMVAQI